MRRTKLILTITAVATIAATGFAAGVARKRNAASVLRPDRSKAVAKGWPIGQGSPYLATWAAAERERQLTEVKGTDVDPVPALVNLDRRIIETIRRNFPKDAPATQERLNHFSYLNRPEYGLRGWSGSIESVDRTDRGFLVTIAFNPRLVSEHATTFVSDQYLETYEITDVGRRFVSGKPADRGPRMIFHD